MYINKVEERIMKNNHFLKISILMKILLHFIFPAILILTLTVVHAQESGRIAGLVLDKVSGDALPGANVFLEGTTIGASSDMNGEYLISKVSPGSYNLVIKYIGYKETSVPINVEPGESVYQVIELEYVAIMGEIIEITAQAEGQIEAINQQLASNTIKNVVSADRIQDIPDANAAESVGRLPGISIVRSGGEGQKVTIRGMAPKYNVMMVNGVRLQSTDRDDRSADLNMISPNMLSGIEVIKALTADMDADAVGGTVNLRINRAKTGFRKNFSLQGGYGSLADTYGNYKITGLLSNRFFNDKLGIQVSGSLDKFDRGSDNLSATYATNETADLENGLVKLDLSTVTISDRVRDRRRMGGGLVLDYQFSKGSLLLNNFISQIHQDDIEQQNYLNTVNQQWTGFVADREFTNTVISNALQGEYEFFNINMDFSFSNSISKQYNPDDLRMNFGPRTTASWSEDSLPKLAVDCTPQQVLNGYVITEPDDIKVQRVYSVSRDVDERAQTAMLNFKIPFNFTNYLAGNLKFGGKYERNTREMDEQDTRLDLGATDAARYFLDSLKAKWPDLGIPLEGEQSLYLMASLFEDADYDIGDFLSGKEGVKDNVFYNKASVSKMKHMEKLAKETYFYYEGDSTYYPYYFENAQASTQYDYNYTRHFGAFYMMAELNLTKYVTLIPGIRYEKFSFDYTADSTVEKSGQTTLGPVRYDNKTINWDSTKAETWFPQLHLRIKPTDWLDIRLASTKSIIYPDYRSVSPLIYWSQAANPQYLRLGNPYIKPAITQNYDIYASVYQNYIGLFTAGYFYKEIDNLIVSMRYDDTREANTFTNGRIDVGTSITRLDTWVNLNKTAYVRGIELDWQTHFWYLPSYLKGVVLNINYTHIKSEAHYLYHAKEGGVFVPVEFDTTRKGRLIDQPDDVLNLTLGYDIGGFSARLSFLYQDNVLRSYDPEEKELDEYTAAYYRWDFTAYQRLPWFKGLQLYLNVNNITDRPDRRYRSLNQKLSFVEYYGRTADFGIRYNF